KHAEREAHASGNNVFDSEEMKRSFEGFFGGRDTRKQELSVHSPPGEKTERKSWGNTPEFRRTGVFFCCSASSRVKPSGFTSSRVYRL
ncbi:Hybrid PKS-NRPS synthetase buaA, partial [Dissostichus eleginoides]